MSPQTLAATISFIGIAGMIGVYLVVLSKSGAHAPYEQVQPKAYGIRRALFSVLLVGFFAVPAFTLRDLPYGRAADRDEATVVDVEAHQWYWVLSHQRVPANRSVVFRVKSVDVNHGFAIYDPDGRLVSQIQAMPGYPTELAVEFDSPGAYKIMCLEYCGLVHHGMVSGIEVVPAADYEEKV